MGTFHKTLARRVPLVSSSSHRCFLCYSAPVVRPLRPPQPRFLSHLHHRTQLQALPHARIPAHPTVLVLRRGSIDSSSSLDRLGRVVSSCRLRATLAFEATLARLLLFHGMGPLLPHLFLHLEVKAAWLYSTGNSCDCSPCDALPIRTCEWENKLSLHFAFRLISILCLLLCTC